MAEYIFELNDALYDEKTGEACFKPTLKGKLVRCKDCKWHDIDYCNKLEVLGFYNDGFCSLGERREIDEAD